MGHRIRHLLAGLRSSRSIDDSAEELTLTFAPGPDDTYVASGRSSDREAQGRFRLPWNEPELAEIGRLTESDGRNLAPLQHTLGGTFFDLWQMGSALYEALFAEPALRRLFETAKSAARTSLRLRLVMDPDQPRISRLHAVPWELLFQRHEGEMASLGPRVSIVRTLMVSGRARPYEPRRALRVLALLSGAQDLNLEEERRRLREVARTMGGLDIRIMEAVCLRQLETTLEDADANRRPFDVLHFAGHGEVSAGPTGGIIRLEPRDGAPIEISGRGLATLLRSYPSIRVIVLNACRTGELPGEDHDPFAGVAAALLQSGVPAVVAIRGSIRDEAAIRFSQTFFGELARGGALEAAISKARRALFVDSPGTLEWVKPVLFLASPRSRLAPRLVKTAIALAVVAALLGVISLHLGCRLRLAGLERAIEDAQKLVLAGQPAAVVAEIDAALETGVCLAPPSSALAAAHAAKALARRQSGDLEGAVNEAEEAIRHAPGDADHAFMLGALLLRAGHPDRAVGHLRRATDLDPDHVTALNETALAYLDLGRPEDARALLVQAVSLEPDNPYLHKNLGRSLFSLGRLEASERELGLAFARLPSDRWRPRSEIAYWLARMEDAKGHAAASCLHLETFATEDREGLGPWAAAASELAASVGCGGPAGIQGLRAR
jgi:tetratricopeptide (TPR) repeat protein